MYKEEEIAALLHNVVAKNDTSLILYSPKLVV